MLHIALRRRACRPAVAAVVVLAVALAAGCDGSSGDTSSSPAPSPSTSVSIPPIGQNGVTADLQVQRWGYSSDGLLSVIVKNNGPGTVRSARGIIRPMDADGNLIAALTAPAGTYLGTRCCTVIGLAPGESYGLYAMVGRSSSRIHSVEMSYTSVRVSSTPVATPVTSAKNASLTISDRGAIVSVDVRTAPAAGPYFTVQAQLQGPDHKFLGVVSSGFFCLQPAVSRTISLEFFHPVPPGSGVGSVRAFPLDEATAKLERLDSCNAD